jgi:tetratricopeptide (TPR) repeat protein
MALAAAALVTMVARTRMPRWLSLALGAGLLGTLGTLTWQQCGGYRDVETFYRRIITENPDCWLAHNNLGNLLWRAGRPQEAVGHYEAALRLKPDFLESIINLADVLMQQGDLPAAAERYEQALQLKPDFTGHLALARLWERLGRRSEAIVHLQAALRIKPDLASGHQLLGDLLTEAGRTQEAQQEYERAAALRNGRTAPHSPE